MPLSPGGSTPGPTRRASAHLHQIVQRGDLDALDDVLRHTSTAEANARDVGDRTPLLLAVGVDSPEAVRLLLQSGAEPSHTGPQGSTPLYEAVLGGRRACAELLLHAGARPNAFELTERHTPLHQACRAGDEAIAELLLRYGADANVPDYNHRIALHMAAQAGSAECVRLLVQHGSRVNTADLQGMTPLDLARDADCQRALVKVGAVLSADGFRRLMRGSPAALERLLDFGVERADDGEVQVNYKPLQHIGADCPFETELVREVNRTGRWNLVQHPAMEVLFDLTRQDVYFTIVAFTRVLFRAILLGVLLAAMVVQVYHPDNQSASMTLMFVLGVLYFLRLMKLVVEIGFTRLKFLITLRMWPEFIATILAVTATSVQDAEFKRIMYSLAIVAAFLDLALAIESISLWKSTIAISSFLYVTHTIIRFLVIFSPILLGFGVAFYVLFGKGDESESSKDEDDDESLQGHFLVVKVVEMLLGNIDAGEIKNLSPQSSMGYTASNIIVTVFVVLVPLAMLNLLLALTISDTAKFLSKGGSEFLKNLALKTAWNQQFAFTLDRWVRTLDGVLPRLLFQRLATFTLRLKWRSTLARPAAMERETPVVYVAATTEDGRTMRASVLRWASMSPAPETRTTFRGHFKIHLSLQQRLCDIVERREIEKQELKDSGKKLSAPGLDATALHEVSEGLKEVQATLKEQQEAQKTLVEKQQTMMDRLAEQHYVMQMILAEMKNGRAT